MINLNNVDEITLRLKKLKPFFTDSDNYFGIYEEEIKKLVIACGWSKINNGIKKGE